MHQFIAKRVTGTLCWSAGENGNEVNVYISSKQVPRPLPPEIQVSLYENSEKREDIANSDIVSETSPGIALHLKRKALGRHIVRFDPEGNPSSWPVGSLLLPTDILDNKRINSLELQINW